VRTRRHPDRARRHQVAGGREPAAERAGLRQAHVDHGPEEGAEGKEKGTLLCGVHDKVAHFE